MTFLDTSTAIDLVLPAFVRAVAEVRDVSRSEVADTGTYTYRYAPLHTVLAAIKQALAGEGLVLAQPVHTDGEQGLIYVSTTVLHGGDDQRGGQWLTFPPLGLRLGQRSQDAGSAISYARRYALMSIFGVSTADDDGEGSSTSEPSSPWRTDEERQIHDLMGRHPPAVGYAVRARFRTHFGQGLSTLPVGRHADALAYVTDALATAAPVDDDHDHDHEGY